MQRKASHVAGNVSCPVLLIANRQGLEARYRIRQGVYRIIYGIEDDAMVVTVVKVGHRREVYARS